MRKTICLTLGLLWSASAFIYAQDKREDGYQFKELKRLPATCVKSQDRTSTCWSWAGISFFESEIARLGHDTVSLSPLYVVRSTYQGKGDKCVRLHGAMQFTPGGSPCDVAWAIERDGIVPMEAYKGMNYGENQHVHGELHAILDGYIKAVVRNPNRKLSTAWKKGFTDVIEEYLGAYPSTFTYKGKEYTPQSFAEEMGLKMDNYVSLTSFTHHPFYKPFAVEIPDNWLSGLSYNLPLDELMGVLDYAVEHGFTFDWAADISEQGFSEGIAVVPTFDTKEMSDAEISKWLAVPKEEQSKLFRTQPCAEKHITQEMRQEAFDNFQTTDDHSMHVMGKAVDVNGKPYFIVKNSWGKYNRYDGYLYASYPYVAYKTVTVLLHKDAIPKEIRKKLGLN